MTSPKDPKVAQMVSLYRAILQSVPTILDPGEHGPLTLDEIPAAAAYMEELGEQVKAERESTPQT